MVLQRLTKRQKIIFFLLIGLLISVFVLGLPAAVKDRYIFGTGSIYERLETQSNLSMYDLKPEEKASAKRIGIIYSVLYVAGTAPIFGLIAILLLQAFSIRTTRFQLGAGAVLAAFGIVLHVGAAIQLGPVWGRSVQDGVVSAILGWIFLIVIFLILFGGIALAKRFFLGRSKTT